DDGGAAAGVGSAEIDGLLALWGDAVAGDDEVVTVLIETDEERIEGQRHPFGLHSELLRNHRPEIDIEPDELAVLEIVEGRRFALGGDLDGPGLLDRGEIPRPTVAARR